MNVNATDTFIGSSEGASFVLPAACGHIVLDIVMRG